MCGATRVSSILGDDKRRHLALIGGHWPNGGIPRDSWPVLGEMAAAHRLEPLLAWRLQRERWSVPAEISKAWRGARRRAGLVALAQNAALRLALERLDAAAIPVVALKGVALAWRHYPEPALRPMRDIDLLVPKPRAREAFALLERAGFVPTVTDEASFDAAFEHGHDLPAQRHGELGVTIELHHRLTDPPYRRGYRMPQLSAQDMLDRASYVDCGGLAVPCPSPQDLAAHLIVHAVYGHRFDCGPLVLADLHFLAAAPGVDWAKLRTEAEEQGWLRTFDLLLALTERWFGRVPAAFEPPPDPVLCATEEALLPDPVGRDQTLAAADLAAARSPSALGRALRRRLTPDPHVVANEGGGRSQLIFWPLWATRRLARLIRSLADRRAVGEARATARVMRWVQDEG